MTEKGRGDLGGIAAMVISVLITALILIYNPATAIQRSIGDWGYLGVFLVMLVSSATIILPAPGLLAVFAAGGAYSPLLVGIAGGLGSALGELMGYLFGYGSRVLIVKERNPLHLRTKEWMERNGFLTLFVFAAIPNPLFDIAGIIAGSLGYPWPKFLLAVALGKIVKSVIFAYLGSIVLF